ncbi:hypothetical protein HRbin02_01133 [Candidatus Calditenuaceae archaeon HR02]|nr:hypothetical protein HRbin02_01133 [Candidatus Calditenuaceae archaeon HR02]
MGDKYPQWMGKMRGLTKEELSQFLAKPYIARIATLKKDGSPYIVPAWFYYEEPYFYFVARAKSVWVEHIKNDPRVAVQISRDDPPYTRVLVEGLAEIVEGPIVGGRWVEIANKMALRYLGERGPEYLTPTLNRPRYLIRVTPRSLVSWEGVEWHPRYI